MFYQHIIENYYKPKYRFSDCVKDLECEKVAGDELSVVLLSKYLRRNITVVGPFQTWSMFPTMKQDIILTFDGRFGSTQDLTQSAAAQSESEELFYLFLNMT